MLERLKAPRTIAALTVAALGMGGLTGCSSSDRKVVCTSYGDWVPPAIRGLNIETLAAALNVTVERVERGSAGSAICNSKLPLSSWQGRTDPILRAVIDVPFENNQVVREVSCLPVGSNKPKDVVTDDMRFVCPNPLVAPASPSPSGSPRPFFQGPVA